ncbi:MAG TPA: copper chaperone PCu(A)C [Pyrinomonadaceae bacterium]|nr:copper chaperone PCu(A)C [Pyrinomonadaceae bacterium]
MNVFTLIFALSCLTGLSVLAQDSVIGRGHDSVSINISSTQTGAPVFDAAQVSADKVVIREAWIQEMPPSQKITAAFMLIENHNAAEISLLSASTDAARVVELHEMLVEEGMMRMRKVDAINVPAGGVVKLEPGGYHLMVIDLNRELKAGAQVRVTLQFSNRIEKTINVPVKNRESMSEEGEGKQ